MKRALITGITGQDGSYLAELLLSKGYEVWGTQRRSSTFNTKNIDHIYDQLKMVYADMTDYASLEWVLGKSAPDEIYNLAAQSHVQISFEIPTYTTNTIALGTLNLLEAMRGSGIEAKVYQASSSEMFGAAPVPQNERTPFHPRSPYGCAKVFAHNIAVNYRESYGMHVSCGILFNHESPRRGETFVTRKISKAVARTCRGAQKELWLGNLSAKRDWGYAPDYVQAMWMMLQQETPDDYVIATGETHTVKEFLEEAFSICNLDWRDFVKSDWRYFRPSEVDILQGDASKAEKVLGWKPTVTFKELVKIMVEADGKVYDNVLLD